MNISNYNIISKDENNKEAMMTTLKTKLRKDHLKMTRTQTTSNLNVAQTFI